LIKIKIEYLIREETSTLIREEIFTIPDIAKVEKHPIT